MRGSGDFEDVVLAARSGSGNGATYIVGGGRPSATVSGGRSVSAGVVAEKEKEKEKGKSGYAKGFERSFLARVGRSVSADKEKERMRQVS